MIIVYNGTLGDLYNSAIWMCVLFANRVVLGASMPLDAYVCVLVSCKSLRMLIITPPLLLCIQKAVMELAIFTKQ